jgi:hypothetical protein
LQVQRAASEEVLVDVPAVGTGLALPVSDGSFVEAEGGDDGLQGAAVGQQGSPLKVRETSDG